mmetsp:Transcript_11602/g.48791  ORF Transcript_11602/g.48791 Transcript_11602/m.48791 type:complete len:227 (-) Transcript_11602:992-1672(-)
MRIPPGDSPNGSSSGPSSSGSSSPTSMSKASDSSCTSAGMGTSAETGADTCDFGSVPAGTVVSRCGLAALRAGLNTGSLACFCPLPSASTRASKASRGLTSPCPRLRWRPLRLPRPRLLPAPGCGSVSAPTAAPPVLRAFRVPGAGFCSPGCPTPKTFDGSWPILRIASRRSSSVTPAGSLTGTKTSPAFVTRRISGDSFAFPFLSAGSRTHGSSNGCACAARNAC